MNEPPIQARLEKLKGLREKGIDPYPARFSRSHTIGEVSARFSFLKEGEKSGEQVTIAGRLVALRRMGKASFLDLRDGSGKTQVHASADRLGEERYQELCSSDIGDFIGVRGDVFRTKMGELTVEVAEWSLLSKALRPLPEKWHGLKDIELRYRHR
ncbi:lysine--tRNA ligase, partial [Candidatus Bipolaricaulota bacterium]|nr:lysine--tRNA ligase [Candidatus Bipolaricaulota bacterium]